MAANLAPKGPKGNLMKHMLYVRDPGARQPYALASKKDSTHSLEVVGSRTSEPNFLSKIIGQTPIITDVTFKARPNFDVHYHPGPLLDSEELVWDFVRGAIKVIAIKEALKDHRHKPLKEIPHHVQRTAITNGISSIPLISSMFHHVNDAIYYPHEGYYVVDLNKNNWHGVYIKGRIYPGNIIDEPDYSVPPLR
jgi:hypothetical protein